MALQVLLSKSIQHYIEELTLHLKIIILYKRFDSLESGVGWA